MGPRRDGTAFPRASLSHPIRVAPPAVAPYLAGLLHLSGSATGRHSHVRFFCKSRIDNRLSNGKQMRRREQGRRIKLDFSETQSGGVRGGKR